MLNIDELQIRIKIVFYKMIFNLLLYSNSHLLYMDNKQLSNILHELEHSSGQQATRLKTEWVTLISSPNNDALVINIMLSQTA